VSQAGGIEPPAAGGPPPRLVADPPAAAGAAEPLDLGVALRLAGVENPTINLARERIQEALADQLAARVLLLPSVNVGGNYHYHAGPLQAGTGLIRNPDAQSLYLGFGAAAVGSGSVAVPGVRLFAHLGDGAFEPLAARRRVSARQSDAHAVQNDILLRVATGYLELVGAEARREVLIRGEAEVAEVVRLTRVFAEKGQGRQGDADRTATRADLVRRAERGAEEDVAVASARLCQLLSLDPSVRLRGPGGAVLPFRLIDEDADAEPLVAAALRARPEVAARAAEVSEAQVRVRQEKVRPLLPLVSVGYSGGLFGGGSNQVTPQFGALQGRSDLDVFAVWNVQGLGFGNRARVRQADAEMGQAIARYDATVNQVRDEVSEGLTDARAAARQLALAKAAVATAEDGFGLERLRIKEGQGRPIEALDSFQQLLDARQELVRAVIAFDVAQFRLFVAVGSTPGAELPAVGPDRR
jgi:outer membrane protein TolC